jgi:hypothetical protein
MKPLTNSSQVFDAWAAQDRPEGRNNNVWFVGERLFSYQTCVAAILTRTVEAAAPRQVCLTTYRRYSATTSGHIAAARTAARQAGLTSIAVASLDAPLDHQRNLLGIAEDALASLRKAVRAREYKKSHYERARKRLTEAALYARFFGVEPAVPITADVATLEEFIVHLQHQPEAVLVS